MNPSTNSQFEDAWNIVFHFSYDYSQEEYTIEEKEMERLCDLLNENTPFFPDEEEPIIESGPEDEKKRDQAEIETQEGTHRMKDLSEENPRRSTIGMKSSFMTHRDSTITLIFSPITESTFTNFLRDLVCIRKSIEER